MSARRTAPVTTNDDDVCLRFTSSKRPGLKKAASTASGALVAANTITFALALCTAPPIGADPFFSAVIDGAASALPSLPLTEPCGSPRLPSSSFLSPLSAPRPCNPAALQRASSSMHTRSWEARRELTWNVLKIESRENIEFNPHSTNGKAGGGGGGVYSVCAWP